MEPNSALLRRLSERILNRRGIHLLASDLVASAITFLLGLAVLWVLVERYDWDEILAAGVSFVAANSLHYLLGQLWIYRGNDRGLMAGYAYFLINGMLGLVLTVALFALLLGFGVQYLVARVIVSLIVGLLLFLLNAFLNFRIL